MEDEDMCLKVGFELFFRLIILKYFPEAKNIPGN